MARFTEWPIFPGGDDARRYYGIGGLLVLFGLLIVYDFIVRRRPHPASWIGARSAQVAGDCGAACAVTNRMQIATAATNHNTRHPLITGSWATTMQVCWVFLISPKPNRSRRSITGMIFPRKLMTPRTYAGICGTGDTSRYS